MGPGTDTWPDGTDWLLHAALDLSGERGYAATTVRAIAEEAGVTPGLVVHHYGTKDNLRRAVDELIAQLGNAIWPDQIEGP